MRSCQGALLSLSKPYLYAFFFFPCDGASLQVRLGLMDSLEARYDMPVIKMNYLKSKLVKETTIKASYFDKNYHSPQDQTGGIY